MLDVVVVLGPWGSGTSAAIGALTILGCYTCPPHFKTNDPRTPNSFEPEGLRNLILPHFDENELQYIGWNRGMLPWFLKDWLAREKNMSDKPLAVKVPALCFFVPEMVEAWNPVFILVERSLDDIENSRLRRGWTPQFGAMGAELAYATVRRDLQEANQEFLTIGYSDLTKNPEHTIDRMVEWVGLSPDAGTRAKAAQFVSR